MDLAALSRVQREAVECVDGASIIIAGAGSGKTRVLTYKIANMIESGVDPSAIMALTFTNKAAREMKARIADLVGPDKARRLWMGTFHSIFARILRDYAELLGFPRRYTIYDASDTRNAIKACIKELQLDEKIYKPGEVQSRISTAKNYLVTAEAYGNNHEAIKKDEQSKKPRIYEIYRLYANKCKADGVLDFDDILLYMNILLHKHPDVLENLRSNISHILVDEYQDTNMAQYKIVNLLAVKRRNITVVGDDSQSIYAFRGARIQNILNFKSDYPEAKEFKLERNYRSTQNIVNAANALITHNHNRLKKECYSDGDKGEKVGLIKTFDDKSEAASVVSSILERIYKTKASYDSFAILYRVNSQSRVLEEVLRKRNIPYIIYAGHSFYERKEVKDMLAYLKIVLNGNDNEAFRRVVNLPARGIGGTTMNHLRELSASTGKSMLSLCTEADLQKAGIKTSAAVALKNFAAMIYGFQGKLETLNAYDMAYLVAMQSGYLPFLQADRSVEGQSALGNVNELLNAVNEYVEQEMKEESQDVSLQPTLDSYMEKVALLTDSDSSEEDEHNKVKLMTVHASKGLEFPYVYIVGLEENLFPSAMAKASNEVEEERRLFYVALTRAEKAVTVSYTGQRFLNGQTMAQRPSRFLREIGSEYLEGFVDTLSTVAEEDSFKPVNYTRPRRLEPLKSGSASQMKTVESTVLQSGVVLSVGDRVRHSIFGDGTISIIRGTGQDKQAVVKFDNGENKTLMLKFAKLQKI